MEHTNRRWRVAVSKTGRDGTWEDRGVWMGETLYGAIHPYQLACERADWERTAWETLGGSPYYRVIDEDDSAYVFHVKPAGSSRPFSSSAPPGGAGSTSST